MLAKPLIILALAAQVLAIAAPACATDLGKAKADLQAFSRSAEYLRLTQLGDRATADLKAATGLHPEFANAFSPQGLAALATQSGQQALIRPILGKAMPLLQHGLGQDYPGFVRGATRLGDAYLSPEPGSLAKEAWGLAKEGFGVANP